jgi:S-adenosylmethionine/arginine decarboxylase-like enzyme
MGEQNTLENWMSTLIAAQGMKILSGPHVAYVENPGNRGLTGVAIIETSHVAVHIWDEVSPALVQLDF